MNAKDENLLVKVIKRAVGLPTASSGCSCGVPAAKTDDCLNDEATENPSAKCQCENTDIKQHEESAQP